MKAPVAPTVLKPDKKGHVCPPSNATHPSGRWETLFVYAFICKFTPLKAKVEGLESPQDFEDALLSPEATNVMTQILSRFVTNLRPQTRNLSTDQISSTVAAVLGEYFKTSERTVFWDESLHANVDPFLNLPGGFFSADWDLKLKILRQLVELQLTHGTEIKGIIDSAWGVVHNKHKRKEPSSAPPLPDPSDPHSRENLQLLPVGQDITRKRYWIADDSPRVWASTNPWKITAGFEVVSSSREEYMAAIEKLKQMAPQSVKKRLEVAHAALVLALEERVEKIDAELARVARVRKKIQQRQILMAQAEIRETRTRRQTRRPDYVYQHEDPDSDVCDGSFLPLQDDMEEDYQYKEEHDDDDYDSVVEDGGPSNGRRNGNGRRRSTRTVTNGYRQDVDDWSDWRGERRSARLGAPPETRGEGPAPKRARTHDSSASDGGSAVSVAAETRNQRQGAAVLKPTETAVDQVGTKKKSKYWFYAVEPVPGATIDQSEPGPPTSSNDADSSSGYGEGGNGHVKQSPQDSSISLSLDMDGS
ncbi:hypothetical protein PUNSTDRAFT_56275 [Punctularia strigosozonata HHB-11173 SS5]|uniref:uncharacterized protein n=1 Tax=Punctularia strigosozonata (strain HHB-11173) TaxID=741275 RepID=UPI00044181D3|nr:uncharacterized protein PUNSTDRAFT_56275 [Punctularia strigosozonata HHB-11173 SS5]EIN13976.1 hypothetical protein PUNSTDRAFT_56275 [Punctularia strigosozonata HHB-11173 SS5]